MKRRSPADLKAAALYPGKRWWYGADPVVCIEVTKRSVRFAFESGATAHFLDKRRVLASSSLRPFTGTEDRAMRKLQRGLRSGNPKVLECRMGIPCDEHHGITHGLEAETLRKGIENLIAQGGDSVARLWNENCVRVSTLQQLLDDTDAGDSLAYLERKPKRKAKR